MHVYDNLCRGHLGFGKFGDLTIGDIRDEASLRYVVVRERVDAIIHCAALAYVHESEMHPEEYFDVNVNGTAAVAKVAATTGVRHLIFASSCSVYGNPIQTDLPVRENTTTNPISVYAQTKLEAESVVVAEGGRHYSAAILRFFNAAGGAPQIGIGESHSPETHIIPRLLRFALEIDTDPVCLFVRGTETTDGYSHRDFVHVLDIAEAHLCALEYLERQTVVHPLCLNIGSGKSTSLLEVIRGVERVTKREILSRLIIKDKFPFDPDCIFADIFTARQLINWMPKRSLDRILIDAHQWLKLEYCEKKY